MRPLYFLFAAPKTFLLLLFIFTSFASYSQQNLGLKFFGLSIHPQGDINASLMPLRLDNKAVLVVNIGAMASYERFFSKDKFSIKIVQAAYSDCASKFGGFTHLGFRGVIFKTKRHLLNGGIGPAFVYRRSWYEIPGYQNLKYFKGENDDTWQYKFLWYGGEFEYNYKWNEKSDFSLTFIPGYPKLMSLSAGFRYWIKS